VWIQPGLSESVSKDNLTPKAYGFDSDWVRPSVDTGVANAGLNSYRATVEDQISL